MNKDKILLIGIISSIVLVIVLGILVTNKINLTGFVIKTEFSGSVIEKTSQIEVWADTNLEIVENGIILTLDNSNTLENQEIEFYENNNLVSKETTNSQGYAKSPFNFSTPGPGTYSAVFQGNPSMYFNPSSVEFNENLETSQVSGNAIQEIQLLELPENIKCEKFTDKVLWTSGYTLNPEGTTTPQTWVPETNCIALNKTNCFLQKISIETRIIYTDQDELGNEGEGYVQISNPDETICDNPQNGIYSRYLAYDTLTGESKKEGDYCGDNKNLDLKCGIGLTGNKNYDKSCYGIKAYASQYSIIDIFSVNYLLCWEGTK